MPIVGFNFTKITAEKGEIAKGDININANVAIKDAKDTKIKMADNKQKTIKVDFHYSAKYEPKVGNIDFEGNLIILEEGKKANEILASWKKNKKLPEDCAAMVMNSVLTKSIIEGIVISRDIGLPPPIQLPSISQKNKDKSYVG